MVARKMASSLSIVPEQSSILEIGGGKGILTRALMELGRPITVVEIDSSLAEKLRRDSREESTVRVINEDILNIHPQSISPDGGICLCANVPYHISGLILRWVSEHHGYFLKVLLMLQKEVALRVCGEKPGKDYGVLSVVLSLDYIGRYLFTVKASNFSPKPKVDSGVVLLVHRKSSLLEDSRRDNFIELVKTAFSQRRKKLHNAICRHYDLEPMAMADLIKKAGLDPHKRPEMLSAGDFIKLYACLSAREPN